MAAPIALVTLLIVFIVSLLIVRIGAIALTMTGLPEEIASFQAASAFSGAGFTTQETEKTVSTPQRRRIISLLIRAGSVGIVTVIASLVLTFSNSTGNALPRFSVLVIGTLVIVYFAQSKWFNRLLTPVLRRILTETTTLNIQEYAHLLDVREGYRLAEITVQEDGWLTHESLRDLHLSAEGVIILGINRRDGSYMSPPDPDTRFDPDDVLIAYGKKHRLAELSIRSDNDEAAHEEAVEEHEQADCVPNSSKVTSNPR